MTLEKGELQEKIINFVKKKKAVFISDIAREFDIHNNTVSDLVRLEKNLAIENKGVAKLVTFQGDEN